MFAPLVPVPPGAVFNLKLSVELLDVVSVSMLSVAKPLESPTLGNKAAPLWTVTGKLGLIVPVPPRVPPDTWTLPEALVSSVLLTWTAPALMFN